MLAGLERHAREAGVAVVARCDQHGVDLGIADHALHFGRGVAEAVAPREGFRVRPVGRAHALQTQAFELLEVRQQHGLRVVACADQAEPHRAARITGRDPQRVRLGGGRHALGLGVLEHDADSRCQLAACHLVEHLHRVAEREAMRDEP